MSGAVATTRRGAPAATGPDLRLALVCCLALATASLALPSAPGYDPWAWLVWGREVAALGLDTGGGPSWKPLPVVLTTVLAAVGDAAPAVWLVVARAAGLLSFVLVYKLAARLATPAGGVVAVLAFVLTPDGSSGWIRLVAEAQGAPLLVALCLWAVDRHLDGEHGQALGLAGAAALLRPEVWPFLLLYAGWLWGAAPSRRRFVVGVLALVPLLWFGGDWWGSGDPWTGGDRAQVAAGGIGDRFALSVGQVADLVMVPVWLAAAAAGVLAWRAQARGHGATSDRVVLALAGAALAWTVVVGAMTTVLRYAGLSRFLAPAAATLCVVAGVGAVRLVRSDGRPDRRAALIAVLALAVVPFALPRVAAVGGQAERVATRAHLDEQLGLALDDAGGREVVLACGGVVAVDHSALAISARPSLAWKLDVPLAAVRPGLRRGPGVVFAQAGRPSERELAAEVGASDVQRLGGSERWAVYAVGCPGLVGSLSPAG